MPKLKSKRGAAKRFKLTASGKIKYSKAFRRHILTNKAAKRKRQMRGGSYLNKTQTQIVKGMLLG